MLLVADDNKPQHLFPYASFGCHVLGLWCSVKITTFGFNGYKKYQTQMI